MISNHVRQGTSATSENSSTSERSRGRSRRIESTSTTSTVSSRLSRLVHFDCYKLLGPESTRRASWLHQQKRQRKRLVVERRRRYSTHSPAKQGSSSALRYAKASSSSKQRKDPKSKDHKVGIHARTYIHPPERFFPAQSAYTTFSTMPFLQKANSPSRNSTTLSARYGLRGLTRRLRRRRLHDGKAGQRA